MHCSPRNASAGLQFQQFCPRVFVNTFIFEILCCPIFLIWKVCMNTMLTKVLEKYSREILKLHAFSFSVFSSVLLQEISIQKISLTYELKGLVFPNSSLQSDRHYICKHFQVSDGTAGYYIRIFIKELCYFNFYHFMICLLISHQSKRKTEQTIWNHEEKQASKQHLSPTHTEAWSWLPLLTTQ